MFELTECKSLSVPKFSRVNKLHRNRIHLGRYPSIEPLLVDQILKTKATVVV